MSSDESDDLPDFVITVPNQLNKPVATPPKPIDHLKFQLKQNNDTHLIHHPSPVTRGADLLLELPGEEAFFSKGMNQPLNWLIPVDKEFLVSKVPFFKALFNTEGFWKETENDNRIQGVSKVTVKKLSNVSNKTMCKFLEMVYARSIYDEYDSKFKTKNYITDENVLEFIELSQFWMVEDIVKEAVGYAEKNMSGSMMMKAYKYDNPLVRETVEPICQMFIKVTEVGAYQAKILENYRKNAEARMKSLDKTIESAIEHLDVTSNARYQDDEEELRIQIRIVRDMLGKVEDELNKPIDEKPIKAGKYEADHRFENIFQYGKRKYSDRY